STDLVHGQPLAECLESNRQAGTPPSSIVLVLVRVVQFRVQVPQALRDEAGASRRWTCWHRRRADD
ncbi:hypothetical protein, partial [Streptomyces microflavus]|uniref:hypothetical protein n=1 Tax=Streptomyces microflavus TaxID=1919 RepID=UPI0033A95472